MIFNLLSKIWFSVLCAACVAVGTLLWTVQAWPAPYMPAVISAVFSVVMLGVIVKFRQDANSSHRGAASAEAEGDMEFEGALGLQVAPLVVAVLVCAMWLFPFAREAGASVASRLTLLTVDAMKSDPNRGVRTTACRELLDTSGVGEHEALFEAFYVSENLRNDCLQPELDAGNPRATSLAKLVGQRWRRDLSNSVGGNSQEEACQAATQLAALGRAEDRVQLLRYSLQATLPEARECFDAALGDISDISTIIGAVESLDEGAAEALLGPLTQRVFFDTSVQDPGWSSDQNQTFVWSLACSMASQTHSMAARNAANSLESMTYDLSCDWNSDTTASTFESVGWAQLCSNLEEPLATSPKSASLCPVVMPHLVDIAVERAKGLVSVSASSFSMHAAADNIASTPVGAGRVPSKQDAARARLMNMTGAELFGDHNPHKPIGCQDMMLQIFRGDERAAAVFEKMGGADLDCGPRPHEKTIGENQALLNDVRSTPAPAFDTFIDRRYLDKTHGKANVDKALTRMQESAEK